MICKICGSEVNEGVSYCPNCGTLFQNEGVSWDNIPMEEDTSFSTKKKIIGISVIFAVVIIAVICLTSAWRMDFLARMQADEKKLMDTVGNKNFAIMLTECNVSKNLVIGDTVWERDTGEPLIWYHGVIENRCKKTLNLSNLHAAIYVNHNKAGSLQTIFFKGNKNRKIERIEFLKPGSQAEVYFMSPISGSKGDVTESELLIAFTGKLNFFGFGTSYLIAGE